MLTIDADTHVIEQPATWEFMRPEEQEFRPRVFLRDPADGAPRRPNQRNAYWNIDGRLIPRLENGKDTTAETREMRDISRRLAHMDEIGVDVQVLYPTFFIRPVTTEHDVEFALARSYNRWLAGIWKQAPTRLRWVAVPPLLSLVDPAKVRAELEFCKAHGACGIFMRGMECERMVTHRYFHPLYEMASDLDLAITFHVGNNSMKMYDVIPEVFQLVHTRFPVLAAFACLLEEEIPTRFPKLRWAFIEASAQWVPYILGEVRPRLERKGRPFRDTILADNNFYVTTQRSDDLNWLLDRVGDDVLVVGTDYGHNDSATEIDAIRRMEQDNRTPKTAVEKILKVNPGRLYGLA